MAYKEYDIEWKENKWRYLLLQFELIVSKVMAYKEYAKEENKKSCNL